MYISSLAAKAIARISGRQTKMLSYKGKETMVKDVIQSMPIYLLSATSPPNTTLKQIQTLTA